MSEKGWIAALGRPGRLVAVRLERGNDVINSIIEIIKSNGLKSGTVTGIGSLNSAKVLWGLTTDISLPKEEATITYAMEGPVELGMGWGVFGTEEDGNVIMHFHAVIMDKKGTMRCGNLLPGSAPVMATIDLTIQELIDMEIKPILDPVLKAKLLHPRNVPE